MTRLNRWWDGASKGRRAVFLVAVLALILAIVGIVHSHIKPGDGLQSSATLSWTCTIDDDLIGNPGSITLVLTDSGSQPITIATLTVAVYDASGDEIGNQTPLDAGTVVTPGTMTSTTHLFTSELSGVASTCKVASWTSQ